MPAAVPGHSNRSSDITAPRLPEYRRGWHMPRYFLHVHIGDKVERDSVGLEFSCLTDAIAAAAQVRTEIMNEDELDQLWLEIMDESGRVLAKVA
jgi:hypothetical protein